MKKDKTTVFVAVADGEAIPLSEVPDEAFASGMLGEGFAVRPVNGTIHTPVGGVVEGIAETGHAYSIRSDSGLDVLVHVGVDTVGLHGEGFTPAVRAGDRVEAGDVIARAELAAIRAAGLDAVTPVLISNAADLGLVKKKEKFGSVRGGHTPVLTVLQK